MSIEKNHNADELNTPEIKSADNVNSKLNPDKPIEPPKCDVDTPEHMVDHDLPDRPLHPDIPLDPDRPVDPERPIHPDRPDNTKYPFDSDRPFRPFDPDMPVNPVELRDRTEILDGVKETGDDQAVSSESVDDSIEYDGQKETNDSSENSEDAEVQKTPEEINAEQKAAIKAAIKRILHGEKLTSKELGNLGEMMMDQYYISQGYTPLNIHRVTSLDDPKGGFTQGIDGVYEKTNPNGTKSYVIADAKYNKSQLGETNDGKQMSDNWIDKRLDDAVGKEKADEIRDAESENPDSVSHEVYHVTPDTENNEVRSEVKQVDSEGNIKEDETVPAETYNENGEIVVANDSKEDT